MFDIFQDPKFDRHMGNVRGNRQREGKSAKRENVVVVDVVLLSILTC